MGEVLNSHVRQERRRKLSLYSTVLILKNECGPETVTVQDPWGRPTSDHRCTWTSQHGVCHLVSCVGHNTVRQTHPRLCSTLQPVHLVTKVCRTSGSRSEKASENLFGFPAKIKHSNCHPTNTAGLHFSFTQSSSNTNGRRRKAGRRWEEK